MKETIYSVSLPYATFALVVVDGKVIAQQILPDVETFLRGGLRSANAAGVSRSP